MAAIVKAYREYWDEMLAVGLGVVITDIAGNTVKSWIGPWLEKIGLGRWTDPATEGLIGFGLLAISETLVKQAKWKIYLRLAAFGATAVAIADAIAIMLGYVPAPAPARPVARPAPPRPAPARPAPRPAAPAPSPARPVAVTVLPRTAKPEEKAAPTPAPAAPKKEEAKIFGS